MINSIYATLKFNCTYKCINCKDTAIGTTSYEKLDSYSVQDLISWLVKYETSPHDMPIGWASFCSETGTNYKCNKCKGVIK